MNHPTMLVLGLDPSLASFGWAITTYDDGDLVRCGTIRTVPTDNDTTRWGIIYRAVSDLLEPGIDVGIEKGISLNSGSGTIQLAGAKCAACLAVDHRLGIQPEEINISTVKLLATGYGNATKAEVTEAAVARWGSAAAQHDIADALWVAEALRLDLHARFPEVEG